jgi:hypothetical protein
VPRAVALAAVLLVATPAAAQAQTPRVRLAAASDCQQNRNCAPGFRRVYGIDPSGSLVRLKVADAGIQALDDGLAEVAVAFSSNPQLSRPDVVALPDDRHMISSDHIVLDAASRLLATLRLRGLNHGTLSVQLAAPGQEILSTSHDGGYVVESGTSMAAPMTSGVAALMASANRRIGGVELRSLLLQSATRSQLPVAAGYVDALRAVLAASTAVGYDASQSPRVRVLQATSKGGRTTVQVAALGSTAAIRRYVVMLDGRRAARLAARASPFTVALRSTGRRVAILALDASGRTLARAQLQVQALRSGKRGAGKGRRVGT